MVGMKSALERKRAAGLRQAAAMLVCTAVVAVCGACASSASAGRAANAPKVTVGALPGAEHPSPPTSVCGQIVSSAPEGVSVVDASSSNATVTKGAVGVPVFLKVAADCMHGAVVSLDPSAASVTRTVPAADGKPALVVLDPLSDHFAVQVLHHDGTRATVQVDLPW